MAEITLVNGMMVKKKAKVYSHLLMGNFIKVTGKIINIKVKELVNGLMV